MNIPRNFHNRSPQSIRRGPPPLEEEDEEDEEVVDEEFDALNDSIIIIYLFAKHQRSAAGSLRFYLMHKNQSIKLFYYSRAMMCIKYLPSENNDSLL